MLLEVSSSEAHLIQPQLFGKEAQDLGIVIVPKHETALFTCCSRAACADGILSTQVVLANNFFLAWLSI